MRTYKIGSVCPIELKRSKHIKGDYLMSPYAWKEGDVYWMALRVVNVSPDGIPGSSYVCFAKGDGVHFQLADTPALVPGPTPEDIDGCEDPTLFFHEGKCKLYYTGWNEKLHQSRLLFASGPDISSLRKHGDVLHGIHHWNLKEATIVHSEYGWRLFYEYSERIQSLIGQAFSETPDGGWQAQKDPFGPRPDHWDSWHLSTGPIAFEKSDTPVMFYNGSDKDANWRIGWVEFDRTFTKVVRRCEEPLVRPEHLPSDLPSIAFAASMLPLDEDRIELYFSIADRRLCKVVVETSESP